MKNTILNFDKVDVPILVLFLSSAYTCIKLSGVGWVLNLRTNTTKTCDAKRLDFVLKVC